MSVDEITERLKAIGPYVRHDTRELSGYTMHTWSIGSSPIGPDSMRATLASTSLEAFDHEDWDKLISDGSLRYGEGEGRMKTRVEINGT